MSSLQPYTAKDVALALLAAGLSVQASAEVDADDLTDAAVELANDISVQICDYAKRDGGLTYIVHQAFREDGEITAIQDLGSAKCLPALIDLLRPLFPVAGT